MNYTPYFGVDLKNMISINRPISSIPFELNHLLKLFEFKNCVNDIKIIGSSMNKIKYISDYDVIDEVFINKKNAIKTVIKEFKNIVHLLSIEKNIYVFDIKCGKYDNGKFKDKPVHWTIDEIFEEKRFDIPDFNEQYGKKTLKDAILDNNNGENGVWMKIDTIAFIQGKYMELTCNYFINSKEGYVNVSSMPSKKDIINKMTNDIKKLYHKKTLKLLKRIYSINKMIQDYNICELIFPILNSDINLLNSISSYLKTLYALIDDKTIKIDDEHIYTEIDIVCDSLFRINTIKIDDKYYNKIKNIYYLIEKRKLSNVLSLIDSITNDFDKIVEKKTNDYIKKYKLQHIINNYLKK